MVPYRRQNHPDLKRQADRRGLAQPRNTMWKNHTYRIDLAHILERADQSPQSFTKLSTELQQMIGDYLLVFKDGEYKCYPQILATSKVVNSALSSRLCGGENVFRIEISDQAIRVHGRDCVAFSDAKWIEEINWPDFLGKVEKLQVVLVRPYTATTSVRVIHVLYSLGAHLDGNDKLKSLDIDVRHLNLTEGFQTYRQTVYPLSILACAKTVRLTDSKTIGIAKTQGVAAFTSSQKAKTLTNAISTFKEARTYASLTRVPLALRTDSHPHLGSPVAIESKFHGAKDKLESQIASQQFFDETWERWTRRAVHQVREALSEHDVTAVIAEQERKIREVQETLRELKSTRTANGADWREAEIRETKARERRQQLERQMAQERRERERWARERVDGVSPSMPRRMRRSLSPPAASAGQSNGPSSRGGHRAAGNQQAQRFRLLPPRRLLSAAPQLSPRASMNSPSNDEDTSGDARS